MRMDPGSLNGIRHDDWLEAQCRRIETAGRALSLTVGEINQRTEQALSGGLGRRRRITEAQLRQAEEAYRTLHDVQIDVQNALFDCEHELRELRERDVNPAELLVDGERLIHQYRFLRRRARLLDGLLAYLPGVCSHASTCVEHLQHMHDGVIVERLLTVPDWSFALVALEALSEEEMRAH